MNKPVKCGIDDDSFPYIFYKNIKFHGLPIKICENHNNDIKKRARILNDAFNQIIKDINYRFEFNREIVPHMHCNIQKNDKIMEIGAYLGYYSMFFAKSVGKDGHVYSIEFENSAYQTMVKNFSFNFPDNTTAIQTGVYNSKGLKKGYSNKYQQNSLRKDVILDRCKDNQPNINIVQTDTLDNIIEKLSIPRLSLITIQVNGSEIEVLEGLKMHSKLIDNIFVAANYGSNGRSKHDHVNYVSKLIEDKGFHTRIEGETRIFGTRKN